MGTSYHIEPERVSLKSFRGSLESRELIPSRALLKKELKERFRIISVAGVKTLGGLIDSLRDRRKIEQFSKKTGLDIDYLTLLKREASSYMPNPVQLKKFPGVNPLAVSKLGKAGIRNSKQLYEKVLTNKDRKALCSAIEVSEDDLEELFHLSDLSRLYGVGPVFARMLYDAGICSVKAFIAHSAQGIVDIYESASQKKADFSVRDIQFVLDMARDLVR